MDTYDRPKLDRLVQFDERSRNYSAVALLTSNELRSYTWRCDQWNDQGREGACVGFAWSHELSARPKVYPVGADFALAIYYRARQLDPWPGEDYDGTSVLAGIKAVKEKSGIQGLPLISEYRWAFGIEDVVRVVGRKGPLVLGINWYDDMYYPDDKGFITPTGPVVGGHAILAKGVKCVWIDPLGTRTFENLDQDKSYVKLHNSWGADWGINGECYITVRDLARLLDEDGEAVIPVTRSI